MFLEDSKSFNPIPVVLEIGSHTSRAGFAGLQMPREITRTEAIYLHKDGVKTIYDYDAASLSSHHQIDEIEVKSPISCSEVTDWDLFEEWIEHLACTKLGADLKKQPLILVEPPIHSREWRTKTVELFFEKLGGGSITFFKSSVMTSYLNNMQNSLIVDLGADSVFISPIYDGFIKKESLIRGSFCGNELNTLLKTNLIGRKADYLNFGYLKDRMIHQNPILMERAQRDLLEKIKSEKLKAMDSSFYKQSYNPNIDNSTFELPDQTNIIIGQESSSIPEKFFSRPGPDGSPQPDPTCLQNLIHQCLESVNLDKRKDMLENIVVTGGTSCISNLSERLEKELKILLMNFSYISKISSPHSLLERQHSAWMGASMVSSMSTLGDYLMDKSEYDDHGGLLIERKCLCQGRKTG